MQEHQAKVAAVERAFMGMHGEVVSVCETNTGIELRVQRETVDKIYSLVNGKSVLLAVKVDRGADTTCGSMQIHGEHCLFKWPRPVPVVVSLADHGRVLSAKWEGLMDLKVNNTALGMVKVLLVDSSEWPNLLVGRDILKYKGLLKNIA